MTPQCCHDTCGAIAVRRRHLYRPTHQYHISHDRYDDDDDDDDDDDARVMGIHTAGVNASSVSAARRIYIIV